MEDDLYLFVKEPGVEPINNAVEQALQCVVIWHKKCRSNQSDWGACFFERLLAVDATCQKAKVKIFEPSYRLVAGSVVQDACPFYFPLNGYQIVSILKSQRIYA